MAQLFNGVHVEADQYFMVGDEYKFEGCKIKDAHRYCQDTVEFFMMEDAEKIIVSNTFTQEWEMEYYMNLAEAYEYRVHTLIVENRHGGTNVHGVPEDKIQQMKDRFAIKL